MKYIVWGCGHTGKMALDFLGYSRILCFASTDDFGHKVCEKNVISYESMLELYKEKNDIIIVVASEKYWKEMENKLIPEQVSRYFVFHESDIWKVQAYFPQFLLYKRNHFMTYTEVLSRYDFSGIEKITVYGRNSFIHYLLLELMEIVPSAQIIVADKNVSKEGYLLGLVYYTDIPDEGGLLLINVPRKDDDIREKSRDYIDLYNIDRFVSAFIYKDIEKYKNIYRGKRVFVIGNGPSLRYEDLEKLHIAHEVCIAANKIYKIFDNTSWRPDYILAEDGRVIEEMKDDINQLDCKVVMADSFHFERNEFFTNAVYYHHIREDFYPYYPGFSFDAKEGIYAGWTVTYSAIQLARYFGATEIYLLGVDHTYTGKLTDGGNHFVKDYYNEAQKEVYDDYVVPYDIMTHAYEKAEIVSYQNGFRIYNATRGGALEVFERVDFDSLFD